MHGVEHGVAVLSQLVGKAIDECLLVLLVQAALHKVHACQHMCGRMAYHLFCTSHDVDDAFMSAACKEHAVVSLLYDEALLMPEVVVHILLRTAEELSKELKKSAKFWRI